MHFLHSAEALLLELCPNLPGIYSSMRNSQHGLQLQQVLETGKEQKNHFCWFNNEKPKECYGHMRYSANSWLSIESWGERVSKLQALDNGTE